MNDQAPQKKQDAGAPAWVMTFADLMSLLMCFFVLLLSFSEMDLQKYKQVAGSMKNAFGVQREIKTMEMPKGTSVIAREFSPGRPSPTPLNVIRQNSIDDYKQTLEFTDVTTKKEDGDDDQSGTEGEGTIEQPIRRPTEAEQLRQLKELGLDDELLENYSQEMDTDPQTAEDAQRLLRALEMEVRKGLIEIGTEGRKILVRIREKGSFPSGSDQFRVDFLPAIVKLRNELKTIPGKIRIAGHTDNVPINTLRFRSNWELSASRSVTVAHELLKNEEIERHRLVVEGHGDAVPLAPNDTAENRAMNRRVELTIVQGEEREEEEYRAIGTETPQAGTQTDDTTAKGEKNLMNTADRQVTGEVESPDPAAARGDQAPVSVSAAKWQSVGTGSEENVGPATPAVLEDSATKNVDQGELEERIRKFAGGDQKNEKP